MVAIVLKDLAKITKSEQKSGFIYFWKEN